MSQQIYDRGSAEDPLDAAFEAGLIITDLDMPGLTVVEGTHELLRGIGCNVGVDEDRWEALRRNTDDTAPIDRDSSLFPAMIGVAASSLVLREENNDVTAIPFADEADNSQQAIALLKSFMGGAAKGGFSEGYIADAVRREIVSRQHDLAKRKSYSAIGAVRYLDDVLDGLDLSTALGKARRLVRGLRAFRRFGRDVY